MVRRRNILSLFYFIAASAALMVPHFSARSMPLNSRTTIGSRYQTLAAPVYLETRDGPSLKIHVDNKLGKDVTAYIVGRVNNQRVLLKVINDNESSFAGLPTEPRGQNLVEIPDIDAVKINIPSGGRDITLPGYINSARLYISDQPTLRFRANIDAEGNSALEEPSFLEAEDPAFNSSWGFMEFDYSPAKLFVNLSFVDFVGLALGMRMTYQDGANQTTEAIGGLGKDGLHAVCEAVNHITGQPSDAPWADLCFKNPETGDPVRVVSPEKYMSRKPSGFDTYYDSYVDEVWKVYANKDLIFDTQDNNGQKAAQGLKIPCRVTGEQEELVCRNPSGAGDKVVATFRKPTSREIFGCAGAQAGSPFAVDAGTDQMARKEIIPRLCAAFSRSTLLASDQPMQVSKTSYYNNAITNHYARLVHQNLKDGKGYSFAYDDVNMDPFDPKENTAGIIEKPNPISLDITVGGYDI